MSTTTHTSSLSLAPTMIRETTKKLGITKSGATRFWAEGKYLLTAGFLPGMFLALSTASGQLTITTSDAPTKHRVSAKDDGAKPVIDLTAAEVQAMFGAGADVIVRVEAGRIIVRAAVLAKRIADRPRDGSMGSAFTGGGLADVAGQRAGLTPTFAVEWNEAYADLFAANHPTARVYNMSVHEAMYADLPTCEVLFMGIPCEPWSMARRVEKGTGGKGKRDMTLPATAHPLGDMALFAFSLAIKVNPRVVIVEEAPAFAASEMAYALINGLNRLGYVTTMEVVNANDLGGMTARKRTVIIAQTPDADDTVSAAFPLAQPNTRTVGSLLDATVDESQWFDASSKAWLFNHAAKQTAKGNGFGFQVVDPNATTMPVFKKRYLAGQGDSSVCAHPTRPGTYRWFTLAEIARCAGLPDTYDLGTSKIRAGEIIGQGVDVTAFTKILAQATGRGDARRVAAQPLTTDTAPDTTTDTADAAPRTPVLDIVTDAVTIATGSAPAALAPILPPRATAVRPTSLATQGSLF